MNEMEISMDRRERIKEIGKQNRIFILFFAGMVLYYGYNMFAIKPWYDELYTYYSFISRGPLYSAIHWPVPNNHVLYSVLSAFLDYLGNPYIGLRGISFLAACANLILLYRFAGKFLNRSLAAGATFLYAAVWLCNNLSIQGRGYTLSVTCYLVALLMLTKICANKARLRDYVIYACSLTAGLYALISSTFWVLPVCFTGGIVLLFQKEYKTLFKLIAASLAGAMMTLILYGVIWLAIGANLMSKDPANVYYGVYQITIILKRPFEALQTGMEYMLATPYIQGDERGYIISRLFHYLTSLFMQFYANLAKGLVVFCATAGLGALVSALYYHKKDRTKWFFGIYLAVTVLMVPLMLIIQSVQPYYRVFTFLGVPVALLITWVLQQVLSVKRCPMWMGSVFCGILLCFSLYYLTQEGYNYQYAGRETEIATILEEDIDRMDSLFYADDYQKYVIRFYYDKEPAAVELSEAEYVLLPKTIWDEAYTVPVWPDLYAHDALDLEYLKKEFTAIRQSSSYELYRKNE